MIKQIITTWGLLCLLLVTNVEAAGPFFAAPGGGAAASCVDATTNVCTVRRAIFVAGDGETINVAAGTYPGAELGSGGFALMSGKLINLTCSGAAGSCIFRTTAATAGIQVTAMTTTTSATWDGIYVDGVNGTAPNYCFWAQASSGGKYGLTITNSTCTNPNFYGITFDGVNLDLTVSNFTLTSTTAVSARSAVYMGATWASGALTLSNITGHIAQHVNGSAHYLINATAASAGPTFSLNGLKGSIVLNPADVTAAEHGIVLVRGIPNAIVQNVVGSVTGPAGNPQGMIVRIDSTSAISSANGQISDITGVNGLSAGYGVAFGRDTVDAGNYMANGGTMKRIHMTCTQATNTIHSLALMYMTGGSITQSDSIGCQYNAISKEQNTTPGLIAGNILKDAALQCIRVKGSQATIVNNTCIQTTGTAELVRVDEDGATNSSNTIVKNNIFYVNGGVPAYAAYVPGSNAATFDANEWYSTNGTISTNGWKYQGNTYTTVATWNADSVVGTDLSVVPIFTGNQSPTSFTGYKLNATSALRRVGVDLNIGNVQDYSNRAFHHPPTIGAYEAASGDVAANRIAR